MSKEKTTPQINVYPYICRYCVGVLTNGHRRRLKGLKMTYIIYGAKVIPKRNFSKKWFNVTPHVCCYRLDITPHHPPTIPQPYPRPFRKSENDLLWNANISSYRTTFPPIYYRVIFDNSQHYRCLIE